MLACFLGQPSTEASAPVSPEGAGEGHGIPSQPSLAARLVGEAAEPPAALATAVLQRAQARCLCWRMPLNFRACLHGYLLAAHQEPRADLPTNSRIKLEQKFTPLPRQQEVERVGKRRTGADEFSCPQQPHTGTALAVSACAPLPCCWPEMNPPSRTRGVGMPCQEGGFWGCS